MATVRLADDGIHGGVSMDLPAFPQPAFAISATETSTVFRLTYAAGYYDEFTGFGFQYDFNGNPIG